MPTRSVAPAPSGMHPLGTSWAGLAYNDSSAASSCPQRASTTGRWQALGPRRRTRTGREPGDGQPVQRPGRTAKGDNMGGPGMRTQHHAVEPPMPTAVVF